MSETKKVNAKAQENKKEPVKKTTTRKTPAKKEPEKTTANKPEIICAKQHPIKDGFKRIGAAAKEFGKAALDTGKAIAKSKPAKLAGLGAVAVGLYKGVQYIRSGAEDEEVFEGTEEPVVLDEEQTDTTEE